MRKVILRTLLFAATVLAVSLITDMLFAVVYQGGPSRGGERAFLMFRLALHGATFVLTAIGAAVGFAFLRAYSIANARIAVLGAGLGLFTLAAVLTVMRFVGFWGVTAWLLVASALVAYSGGRFLGTTGANEAHPPSPPGLMYRLILLFACLGAGSLIGYVGLRLTGGTAWFLAVPACVVIGWFTVANPTECLPVQERKPKGTPN